MNQSVIVIDGARAVSTTHLSRLLAIPVTSKGILELKVCEPVYLDPGIYWFETDIPLIARGIANRVVTRAMYIQAEIDARANVQ